MKTRIFLLTFVLALMFTATLTAQAASNKTLNFSQYADGTTIDNVNIPGVTFIAANPANVTIQSGQIRIGPGVAGIDLTNELPRSKLRGIKTIVVAEHVA